jgi:hypothetical protein
MELPRLPVLALVLVSAGAQAQTADAGASHAAREMRVMAQQLADDLLAALVGKRVAAGVAFGALVCGKQAEVKRWQDAIAYERSIGKESGVVNMEELHSFGEMLVLAKNDLKDARESARHYKVTLAACSHPGVLRFLACEPNQDKACRDAQANGVLIAGYSAQPETTEEASAALDVLQAKAPDIAADLKARVDAVVALLGPKK